MKEKRSTIRGALTFSESEKIAIIEEYLEGNLSKADVWRKHTGYNQERGGLLRWMRQLGYSDKPNYRLIFKRNIQSNMTPKPKKYNPVPTDEELEIKRLKKELEDAKLKAEGFELMIEIAEKELNIPIRKKSDTK